MPTTHPSAEQRARAAGGSIEEVFAYLRDLRRGDGLMEQCYKTGLPSGVRPFMPLSTPDSVDAETLRTLILTSIARRLPKVQLTAQLTWRLAGEGEIQLPLDKSEMPTMWAERLSLLSTELGVAETWAKRHSSDVVWDVTCDLVALARSELASETVQLELGGDSERAAAGNFIAPADATSPARVTTPVLTAMGRVAALPLIGLGEFLATPFLTGDRLTLETTPDGAGPDGWHPPPDGSSVAVSADGRLVASLTGRELSTAWVQPRDDGIHLASPVVTRLGGELDGARLLACRPLGHAIVAVVATAADTRAIVLSSDGARVIAVSGLLDAPASAATHVARGICALDGTGACVPLGGTDSAPFAVARGLVTLDGIDTRRGPVVRATAGDGSAWRAIWTGGSWAPQTGAGEVADGALVRMLGGRADSGEAWTHEAVA